MWGGNTNTKDEEKTEVLSAFFVPGFSSKSSCVTGTQHPELGGRDRGQNEGLIIQEGTVSDLLCHLDPHTTMELDRIHARAPREIVEELTKPHPIIISNPG